ncbi:MAG TPA: hypothetical protein VFQ38_05565 [Longimicrobiales bacterium]|nr:hypothetical protein [Longimicrobiales bacterium]
MADIHLDRRRGAGIWPWIIGLVVLGLLIWAIAELVDTGKDRAAAAVTNGADVAAPAPTSPAAPAVEPPAAAPPATAQLEALMPLGAEDEGQTVLAAGEAVGEPTNQGFWLRTPSRTVIWVATDQPPKSGRQVTGVTGVLRRAGGGMAGRWLSAAKYAPEQGATVVQDLYLATGATAGAPPGAASAPAARDSAKGR